MLIFGWTSTTVPLKWPSAWILVLSHCNRASFKCGHGPAETATYFTLRMYFPPTILTSPRHLSGVGQALGNGLLSAEGAAVLNNEDRCQWCARTSAGWGRMTGHRATRMLCSSDWLYFYSFECRRGFVYIHWHFPPKRRWKGSRRILNF